MTPDAVARAAHRWLALMTPREQRLAMEALEARLAEDQRERDAAEAGPGVTPEFWCISGKVREVGADYPGPFEVVLASDLEEREVAVLDGYAVVRRRYAVPVSIGVELGPEGALEYEIQWFSDRAKAEEFAARIRDTGAPEPEAAP